MKNKNRPLFSPDGSFITYTPDELNRLTAIKDQAGATIAGFTYDPLSRRTQLSLANGTSTSYQYDAVSRLTSLQSAAAGNRSYTYDKVGNRKTMVDPAGTHSYSYDALYQLASVDYPSGFAFADTTFAYDKLGNRTQVTAGAATAYTANALNQYTQVGSSLLSNDANGNLTSDGTNTYTYDAENRLTQATTPTGTATYTYDPLGRRLSKTVAGTTTRFLYDGDQLLAETDASGTITAKYVYGPGIDEPLKLVRGGTTSYYHADGLGSVIALTNASGTVVERYAYDVYGTPRITDAAGTPIAQSSVGNRFLFTGRELDSETGLYYYRSRYYDPRAGRFLSRDPLGYLPDTNLYRYVWNNPSNRIDPSGLITRHEDGVLGTVKEFLDVFEAEASLGFQVGAKIQVVGGKVEWEVDLGTQRTAFEGAALQDSTTQGLVIGATFGDNIGLSLGRTKERAGHPAPQIWDGGHRISGESNLEYLQWVDWKDGYTLGFSRLSADEEYDLRVGGGAAFLFGFEGNLNLSELYDFATRFSKRPGTCKGQSN